jgi:hypothetical protein
MNILEHFHKKLYEVAPASFVGWTRIVILSFLLLKFLSRDYSLFGIFPEILAEAYPANVFHPLDAYVLLGFKWVVDLCTFHWIHWFVPFPSEFILHYIEIFLELVLLVAIFLGGGYKKINYLIIYVLGMYLLGFLFRVGSDIDEIFIQMQIVLLLFLFREKETYILFSKQQNPLKYSKENGWFFSMVLLIFIGYYFLAGITKIVDISFLDWGRFELANLIELNQIKLELGDDRFLCFTRDFFIGSSFLDIPGTVIVYAEHLLIPLLFFNRKYISFVWFIYILFHLSSLNINLFFTGSFLSWLVFFPVHRLFQQVHIRCGFDTVFCKKNIVLAKKLDWFNRFIFIDSKSTIEKEFEVKGLDSFESNVGFDGFRRMLWAMPLFWVILPLLYIPFLPTFIKLSYNQISKKR